VHAYAWFNAIANATNPVGLKKPNQFGLHDMIGNVWEWTQDCWNLSYSSALTDGSAWTGGDCSRRILRGGSWIDVPQYLRPAVRGSYTSSFRHGSHGFRVARDL
jgi:formylglycine-generating enzyme required for sulfatase activity